MSMPAVALSTVHGAPHAHDESSVRRIMLNVLLALAPSTAFGVWVFGWPAVNLLVVTVLATLVFEAIAVRLRGQDVRHRLGDGSALLAGWLLALSLPAWAPWWIGVCGGAIAMLLAKHPFGGLGQNVFNPAIVARVSLLIAFPVEMTAWPPLLNDGARMDFSSALEVTFGGGIPDGLSGATFLSQFRTVGASAATPILSTALGLRPGSFGETSAALILLGGAWLLMGRVISWRIPVASLLGVLVPAALLWVLNPGSVDPLHHLLSGGLLFTAFFIATDPATSPASDVAKLVYGAGLGLIVFVIRSFCALPEGVGFAVLLMNAFTPMLDRHFKPRVYGRNRRGAPLSASPGLGGRQ